MATEANSRLAGLPIGMMERDVVLPSQHFGARRMQAPEQRLMIAVLQDALECLLKHRFAEDANGQRLFQEARHWFVADEADWPYSFECICGALDLDSNAVRQRLRVVPQRRGVGPHQMDAAKRRGAKEISPKGD